MPEDEVMVDVAVLLKPGVGLW